MARQMMFSGFVAVVALVVLAAVAPAQAAHEPPAHAMSGEFARLHQRQLLVDVAQRIALPLNHDDSRMGTFSCRYYTSDLHYDREQGVCFFEMGGEAPNNGIGNDYIADLAKRYKALQVSIEHRFYGESVPGDDFSVDNLHYLTSRQALADAAALIDHVNRTYHCRKWMAFGGSYSGALSAWFRTKYPHIIDGALSSSGVVNAVLNFVEFDEQVAEAIGDQCADNVRYVTAAFVASQQNDLINAATKALFGLDPGMDDGDFAYMLADSAAMAAQYNNKAALCDALANVQKDSHEAARQRFANFTNFFWGSDFGSSCFYDRRCVYAQPTRWQPTARSWWWQKCYELAYWQNHPQSGSLRMDLITMDYHQKRCNAMFGLSSLPDTNGTNAYYGGAAPNTTKVYFSNFSDDPWQQASVRKELSPSLPFELVHCDGCGHCDDLHLPSRSDPPQLTASRQRFETYLTTWLK